MSVVGSISIKDNVSAVLRSIRKEQSVFRQDVESTKKKLKDAWGKKYDAKFETTPAMKKMKDLRDRIEPFRKKLVKAVVIKDLASEKIRKVAGDIKRTGKMIAKPVINIAVNGTQALGAVTKVIGNTAKFAAIGIAGIGAAGAAALKGIYSGSEEAAKAQIEAETKLEAVLGNVASIKAKGAGAAKAAKKELMGVASELQGIGVIGDEVTLAGMQQLATFQLSEKAISKLAPGMTDLLAQQKGLNATQEDAVGIGNLIGKVMTGQVGALSRVGITFDKVQEKALKVGTAEEKAAVLAEVLQQNVGGVNKALAEQDQGKIQQVANAYGDMKEEVGKVVLGIKSKLASAVMENIPLLQELGTSLMSGLDSFTKKGLPVVSKGLKAIIPMVQSSFSKVGAIAKYLMPIGKQVFKGFIQGAKNMKPVLEGIMNGFAPLIPQMSSFATGIIATMVQMNEAVAPVIASIVNTIIGILPVLIPVLSNVMNTVSSIITGAAPIIEGMVQGVGTVVQTLAPIFSTIFSEIGDKVGSVIGFVSERMGFIQEVISTTAPLIGGVISTAWGVISPVLDILISTFKILFSVVQRIFPGIQKTIETVWNVVKPLVEGIGSVMGKIAGWFGDVADAVTSSGADSSGTEIGHNAKGDNNWKGGLTWVGEQGPELVNLPKGSRILPNKESISVVSGLNNSSGMRNIRGGGNLSGNENSAIVTVLKEILNRVSALTSVPKGSNQVGSNSEGATKNVHLTIQKIADVIQVRNKEEADELTDMVAKKILEVVLNMP